MACCPGPTRYSFAEALGKKTQILALGAQGVLDRIVLEHDLGNCRGTDGLPGQKQKNRCGTRRHWNPGLGKHRWISGQSPFWSS